MRSARMPEVTLSLPIALGLLAVFLIVGGTLVFFALRQTDRIAEPTVTPTPTISPTASLTPTPETPTATHTAQPSPTPLTYIVQDRDTCGGIAAAFDVSVQSIILANSLSSDCALFVSQELLIPQPTPTSTPEATATLGGIEATVEACGTDAHVVQENDTMSMIAASYGVPEEAIMEFNGLVSDVVFVGQRLLIPQCERIYVGGSTVTPSPAPPYPAPELLLPLDGASFTLADDVVTLQWSSVGTLRANEAYQVTVVDVTGGENRQMVDQVTDTKFIVPDSFRQGDSSPHVFRWFVVPVAQRGVDEDGLPVWEPGGPPSTTWVFTWSGSAPQQTPQP